MPKPGDVYFCIIVHITLYNNGFQPKLMLVDSRPIICVDYENAFGFLLGVVSFLSIHFYAGLIFFGLFYANFRY